MNQDLPISLEIVGSLLLVQSIFLNSRILEGLGRFLLVEMLHAYR